MGILFVYILKSSACLAMFYLFYKLLLSHDTFHRFNRMALLSIIALSVVIPFCEVTMGQETIIQRPMMGLEQFLLTLPPATAIADSGQPWWIHGFIITYILGGISILGFSSYSFYTLFRIMRQGSSTWTDGIRLIITEHPVAPFSWMRTIVINRPDYEESGQEILTHEMAHVKARHSLDLLFTGICILFHWFNPAAWLLQHELRNIHEYEADENVLNQGIDARKYQLLLIKKAVGSQRFNSMANSFNHNSLKKRIAMMLKQKSSPWARLKYLYVLPLVAVTVAAFARPEISKELEKISSVKFSEIIPIPEISSADTVAITPVLKSKAPVVVANDKDTTEEAIDMETVEESNAVTIHLDRQQAEIQTQVQEALASAKIQERVAAEMEKIKPQIEAASSTSLNDSFKGIVYIDGMESTLKRLHEMNPDRIEFMNIWKNGHAVAKFGEKGRNGVIEVKTKR